MTLTEVAAATGLARPTARRLLLTLEELGYVRADEAPFALTPRCCRWAWPTSARSGCGTSPGRTWTDLVARTARVLLDVAARRLRHRLRCPRRVPKLITLRVEIGTRFPALQTSQGKVLLAALPPARLAAGARRAQPVRAPPRRPRDHVGFAAELEAIRARGWALADEELAPGIRSVAVPVRDGAGHVRAAMNVTVHAAETSVESLADEYLPLLLRAAGEVSADWALWQSRPHAEVSADVPAGGLTVVPLAAVLRTVVRMVENASQAPESSGPLSAIVVADFSRVLAGPYCTMLLADLGADVIKVEGPGRRRHAALGPARQRGRGRHLLPGGQPQQALDRARPRPTRTTSRWRTRWPPRADVFIHNFKPGGLTRFGLDYDAVPHDNPRVVYCSISGFGSGQAPRCPATTCWSRVSRG